jgi:NAD-dependent SIR2 family protein deacetylase
LAQDIENLKMKLKEEGELLRFKCKKCNISFPSNQKLKDHSLNNHPRENKCNECEQGFKEHWKFELHLKEHGKVKVFECNRCEKTFYTE